MLNELITLEEIKFVTVYKSNTLLKCDKDDITGNIVGEHLLRMESLPPCPKNYCQWKYISKVYRIPYHTCISLLGNAEQNWINYCSYHPILDRLLCYWLAEGFKIVEGGIRDFKIQRHNIKLYADYALKDQFNSLIRANLNVAREENLKKMFQESPEVINLN